MANNGDAVRSVSFVKYVSNLPFVVMTASIHSIIIHIVMIVIIIIIVLSGFLSSPFSANTGKIVPPLVSLID